MERATAEDAYRNSERIAACELAFADYDGRTRFLGPIRTVLTNAERVLVAAGELA